MLAAAVVPAEHHHVTVPAPADGMLREHLGPGRLAAAAEVGDVDAAARIVHQVLGHPWLGPVVRGCVLEQIARSVREGAA